MVPAADQGVVDNNAVAAVASANAVIDHTYTANPTGPYPTISKGLLNSDPTSEKEGYSDIEEVDVTALDPDKIVDVDAKEEHY